MYVPVKGNYFKTFSFILFYFLFFYSSSFYFYFFFLFFKMGGFCFVLPQEPGFGLASGSRVYTLTPSWLWGDLRWEVRNQGQALCFCLEDSDRNCECGCHHQRGAWWEEKGSGIEARETPKLNGWIGEEEPAMQTERVARGAGGKPQGHRVVGGALGQG